MSNIEVIEHGDIEVEEEEIEVVAEPQLFSPVASNGFLDTTSQNVLTKPSEHPSRSSSNNSKCDYELVNIATQESFEEVHIGRGSSVASLPCIKNSTTSSRTVSGGGKPCNVAVGKEDNASMQEIVDSRCHCGTARHRGQMKRDVKPHQGHSGASKRHTSNNNNGSSGRNSKSDSNSPNHSRQQHRGHRGNQRSSRGYIESTEEASSNNTDSEGEGTSTTSSSTSDNVGLKIVKALERMDDNMHLILKRLDSIDKSMKILAEQPPPPWWVSYIPSRSVVISTLWPFVVQLIVFYFWRRMRRRRRAAVAKNCSENLVVTRSDFPHLT